jgi:hypothetical protein
MVATVLVCWVLALGEAGHLYPLAKKVFPWIGIARFPVKFTILTSFLVPLLAAGAVQKVGTKADDCARRGILISGGIFLALAAGLVVFARANPFPLDAVNAMTGNAVVRAVLLAALIAALWLLAKMKTERGRLMVQFAALGILLTDLLTHSPGITLTLPSSVLAPGLWQARGNPAPAPGSGRIMVSPDAERQMLFSRVADPQLDFLGKRLAEWYNLNLLDSLPKVNGAITLRPAHFDVLESYLYYTAGGHCGRGLLDFLSVAWLSAPDNPAQWQARTNFLPVITAGQKPVFESDEHALQSITAEDFNPRDNVFLPESERAAVTVTSQTLCAVTSASFRPNHVEADINAAAPSLVVLSQSYYHLWHAFVDEKSTPLLRANLAFQAVEVPAGRHHLKLIYRDPNLEIGAALSVVSLLACGFIWRRAPNR